MRYTIIGKLLFVFTVLFFLFLFFAANDTSAQCGDDRECRSSISRNIPFGCNPDCTQRYIQDTLICDQISCSVSYAAVYCDTTNCTTYEMPVTVSCCAQALPAPPYSEPPEGVPSDVVQLRDLESIFARILLILLGLATLLAFIFIVVGGLKFITSGGDPKEVEAAKKSLTYAIGGLILVASAYLIIHIIGVVTGANTTNFRIFIID
jgi:hypothetical protein